MDMKRIAIAGATGLVGETLLRLLESGPHQIEDLRLLASARSAGAKLLFRDREYQVKEFAAEEFKGLDVAFFCVEPELARKLVPEVAKLCPVIDKSSEFRLKPEVPLVVPEVNSQAIKGHKNIIANPNCTTIPLAVAVAPLHKRFGLEALYIATYQSVSGAGRAALNQYRYETEFVALGRPVDTKGSPLPYQIADNVIPQIDSFDRHGHTGEELKLMQETAKILSLPDLRVCVTCVRVPVSVGHCLAVTAVFSRKVTVREARNVLQHAQGLVLSRDNEYATPADCRGRDAVYVSRVRQGAKENELQFWVATDNLRKGAALNAIQIAELIN
ncbi:MAG: aspartate-semialdehyde dehydrogenase [candidate division WOR-3 bacterium]